MTAPAQGEQPEYVRTSEFGEPQRVIGWTGDGRPIIRVDYAPWLWSPADPPTPTPATELGHG